MVFIYGVDSALSRVLMPRINCERFQTSLRLRATPTKRQVLSSRGVRLQGSIPLSTLELHNRKQPQLTHFTVFQTLKPSLSTYPPPASTSTTDQLKIKTKQQTLSTMPSQLPPNVHISTHPCLQAKLSQLRNSTTNARETKALVHEISLIVGCEALASLQTAPGPQVNISTPIPNIRK